MEKSLTEKYSNFHPMPSNCQTKALFTIVRDETCTPEDFCFYADRLNRLLVEFALAKMPYSEKIVITPTNKPYRGYGFARKLCAVSIVRAGESMEKGVREVCRSIRIGKILIQRDEETALPKLFYVKLPPDIANRTILLLDPMLATGGSAMKAVQVLIDNGVDENNIIFCNLIGAPEGIHALCSQFPKITVVCGEIDERLNERKFIEPGIGDFGDRYFGTL